MEVWAVEGGDSFLSEIECFQGQGVATRSYRFDIRRRLYRALADPARRVEVFRHLTKRSEVRTVWVDPHWVAMQGALGNCVARRYDSPRCGSLTRSERPSARQSEQRRNRRHDGFEFRQAEVRVGPVRPVRARAGAFGNTWDVGQVGPAQRLLISWPRVRDPREDQAWTDISGDRSGVRQWPESTAAQRGASVVREVGPTARLPCAQARPSWVWRPLGSCRRATAAPSRRGRGADPRTCPAGDAQCPRARLGANPSANCRGYLLSPTGRFQLWCRAQGIVTVDDLTTEGVSGFLAAIADRDHGPGLKASTINKFRTHLRSFAHFQAEAPGYGSGLQDIERIRVPRMPREQFAVALARDDERCIVDACTTTRDRLILELLLATGLRVSEMAALTLRVALERPPAPPGGDRERARPRLHEEPTPALRRLPQVVQQRAPPAGRLDPDGARPGAAQSAPGTLSRHSGRS